MAFGLSSEDRCALNEDIVGRSFSMDPPSLDKTLLGLFDVILSSIGGLHVPPGD